MHYICVFCITKINGWPWSTSVSPPVPGCGPTGRVRAMCIYLVEAIGDLRIQKKQPLELLDLLLKIHNDNHLNKDPK